MKTIAASELRTALNAGEAMQLVDVRSAAEFAGGHIPGAVNIPLEQVEIRLADMSRSQPLVLVCQGGTRAAICHDRLKDSRENLLVLEGGTQAWIQAGLPVVASEGNATAWSLERQVRLVAGVLVFTGAVLAWAVSTVWIALPAFVGLGLTMAGLTGLCPMARLLARLPWNRPRRKMEAAATQCSL